ncbi:MAG: hypothetical protein JXR79_07240 [Nitrospirae bacterium]|nr:hypothetical protein [Nitrospirota bacterium]
MKSIISLKTIMISACSAIALCVSPVHAEQADCAAVAKEYIDIIQKQKNEIEKLKSELSALKKRSYLENTELQKMVSMLQAALDFSSSKPEEKQQLLKQADEGINENHPRIINLMMRLNKAEEDLKVQTLVSAEKSNEISRLRKELREKEKECEVGEIIKEEKLPADRETIELLNQEIEDLEAENLELQNELELLRNISQKLTEELELIKAKE